MKESSNKKIEENKSALKFILWQIPSRRGSILILNFSPSPIQQSTLYFERENYLILICYCIFCNIIHITSSSTPNFEKCKSYLILLLTLPSWTQYDTIYLSGPRYQDITTKVFCCIRPNTCSNQERILMRHLQEEKRQQMQSLAEHSVLAAVSTLLASCLGVSGHKSASLNQGSQSGYSKYVLLSLPMQCQDQICTHKRDNQS